MMWMEDEEEQELVKMQAVPVDLTKIRKIRKLVFTLAFLILVSLAGS